MYNQYENKVVGYINDKIVHYDKQEGYAIEIPATGIRNPTSAEQRKINVKYGRYGDLEKKCKG